VVDWIVRILINGAALIVAAKLVPNIHLKIGPFGTEWLEIAAIAFVFALVNTYIKPIVKTLSFPLTLMTLGLISFVINAALLLLTAWIAKDLLKLAFTVGNFPPTIDGTTIIAAILGAIVISIVSIVLGLANFGRKVAGLR
jgi:putative membrane protein